MWTWEFKSEYLLTINNIIDCYFFVHIKLEYKN